MCKLLLILVSITLINGFHVYGFIPLDVFGFYAVGLLVWEQFKLKRFDLYLIALSIVSIGSTFSRSSGNDLVQCGRILITLFDGYGVYRFYRSDLTENRLRISVVLLNVTIPYILCGSIALLFPVYGQMFSLSQPKAVVALFPLLVMLNIVTFGFRILLILTSVVIFILGANYESRSMMAGVILFLFYHLIRISYRSAVVILGLGFVGFFVLVKIFYDDIVYSENTSNTFRVIMSFGVFDFSLDRIIFGIGGNEWQDSVANVLSWKDNSEGFFSTKANPHFLPTEIIIYGGMISLIAYMRQWHTILKVSFLGPELIACLVSSIFTTNTGVERMFLAVIYFVAIGTSVFDRNRLFASKKPVG